MNTFIGTIGLAAVSFLASGCLIKDTTQTVYLEPDGTVTWSVLEKDVRSDAPRAEDRADLLDGSCAHCDCHAVEVVRCVTRIRYGRTLRRTVPYARPLEAGDGDGV